MKSAVKIIESLCASKSGCQSDCEDVLVRTPNFVAVVDGATDKTGMRLDGKTGGRLAAELIGKVLEDNDDMAELDGNAVVAHIQSALQSYAKYIRTEYGEIPLTASAAIYSIAKRQVWIVGDCQCMTGGKLYANNKKVDAILSEARALAIHMLLQSGVTEQELLHDDRSRQFIMPWLQMQHLLENSSDDYGYPVFSCNGVVKEFLSVDVPAGSSVVLATDGYPKLMPTLEESEAVLEQIRRDDPLCYRLYKSTKGIKEGNEYFDDRTYVSFLTI